MGSAMRGLRPAVLACGFVLAATAAAVAQDYPSKTVHLVVPAAPGGITDIMARLMAEHVGRALNQRMVVENKPAGGGNVGIGSVAQAAPDGYTLLLANVGQIACNPWLYKDVPFDTMKELVGVGPVGAGPSILMVNAALPVATAKEFIAFAKANPGKLNYGTAGPAGMPRIVGEQFNHVYGVEVASIPYRGAAPAAVGLGAGEVQAGFIALGSVKAQVQAGTIRLLAVVSPRRLSGAPDLPTFDEAGLPGFDLLNWFGVVAPAGTPRPAIEKLNLAMKAMVDEPAVRARFAEAGIEAMAEPPADFDARIRRDYEKYGEIIKRTGMRVE
ncbi:MAG: Bug family tripartite tricarboxylate transporter substrate binding protein [Rhodospirillaceae bacterium]